jgi:Flp pilus assembly CpaF family ATPase
MSEFKREIVPQLVKIDLIRGGSGKPGRTTLGSAWVEYIDQLERSGYISDKQADNWDNPFSR